ncbi:MAG: zinc-ribbon domain containing protein [Bacteroidota bacterium]
MKAHCKVCNSQVDASKMKQVFKSFAFEGQIQKKGSSLEETFLELVKRYPDMYQWACDDCIENEKALVGNPQKQFYTFTYPWDTASPFFAYYDKHFSCQTCKEKFTFSKEEQQYWYEELNFVVYSKPINCADCRKKIRSSKNLNKTLSELLREGKPEDLNKLQRIAEIYHEMGKPEKMKTYLAEAEKLKRKAKKA